MKLPTKIILSTLIVGSAFGCLAAESTHAVESNLENFDSTLIITGINPGKNEVSFIFNAPKDKPTLSFFNLLYSNYDYPGWEGEERIDNAILPLKRNNPVWAYRYYGHTVSNVTSGVERLLTAKEVAENKTSTHYPLMDNKTGKMYYSAQTKVNMDDSDADSTFYSGKIDYSACLNTSVYHNGVECRAELYGPAKQLIYYPYENGVRMDAPDYQYPAVPTPKPAPTPEPEPTPTPISDSGLTPNQPISVAVVSANSKKPSADAILVSTTDRTFGSDLAFSALVDSNADKTASLPELGGNLIEMSQDSSVPDQTEEHSNLWLVVLVSAFVLGSGLLIFFVVWRRKRS